ncbi:MAG: alpha/beta hydrolase [Planctomycetia bacterium]|nr:alpha/beta hydrolase [Planctomycetia bacterium]
MAESRADDLARPIAKGRVARANILRRWVRWTSIPVASYLVMLWMMMALEDSLIFFPSVYPEGFWQPVGFQFEDAWFTASDGIHLHGWYVPHPQPRAVVLFAHGNAGNISHRTEILELLANRLGVSVLIFDYRGYGRSEGRPSGAGILADARAARRWLAERAKMSEAEVVLMGESLGGAVLVDLAAKDGARALILENTFSSLPDVAAFHYPWVPVKLFMRTQLNSTKKIRDYHGPLLQIHGDADTIIPLALAERLYDAANPPKQFVLIRGGDHNDPRTPAFVQALDQFFAGLAVTPTESKSRSHTD